MKSFIAIIFTVFILVPSTAQNIDYIDNQHNAFVYQSKDELWISSAQGWNRYDGITSKGYLTNDTLSGLKGDWIQSGFFVDDEGRLWTCTYRSLCYFSEVDNRFECYVPEVPSDPSWDGLRIVDFDLEVGKLLVRVGETLGHYDQTKNTVLPLNLDVKSSSIVFDSELKESNMFIGSGWISNQSIELWFRKGNEWEKRAYDFGECSDLPNLHSKGAAVFDGKVWLSTNKGLLQFNQDDHCNSRLIGYEDDVFISNSVLEKDGFIFVTTDRHGILVYSPSKEQWVAKIDPKHSYTPLNYIRPSYLFDLGSQLLVEFKGKKPQFLSYSDLLASLLFENLSESPEASLISSSERYTLLTDKSSELLIYRDNNLIDKLKLNIDGIIYGMGFIDNTNIYFHDEDNLWSYDIIEQKQELLFQAGVAPLQEFIVCADDYYIITANQLYLLTKTGMVRSPFNSSPNGLLSYLREDNHEFLFETNAFIHVHGNDTTRVLTNSYYSDRFYDDETSTLYMALRKGLGIYTVGNKAFEVIDIDGAAVNDVNSQGDYLLLSTSKGIYIYKEGGLDRLATSEINCISSIQKGQWIHTITDDGLKTFKTDFSSSISEDSLYVSRSNHKVHNEGQQLLVELDYDDNYLELYFKSSNYLKNEQGKYTYRIDEQSSGWSTELYSTPLRLQALAIGTHELYVCGVDETLGNTKPLFIRIVVHGPLWTKWWFILLALSMLSALVWWYVRLKTNRVKKQMAVAKEIQMLEKSALQAQMNPHFIFNCLNSIQNFIMDNDKEKAMDYLGRFAQLIRANLNASIEDKVTLDEECRILENYLSLEQLRLNYRFDYNFEVSKDIDRYSTYIPSMLIQPFVENAVIHGMSSIPSGGKIVVRFDHMEDRLHVTIIDNGTSYHSAPAKHGYKSVGTQITEKRLNYINQTLADSNNLMITHSKKGTTVSLSIALTSTQ